MGLIKAAFGAAGGALADQWKEFFYCDSIDNDVLVLKGSKKTGGRSSNTKGSDNIISNGSVIAVADGQCMIIVDQGKVVELCAEPGEFVYDTSAEPSIFSGSLGTGILDTFKSIGKRFTFGGEAPRDQRVYYFNTKEIGNNKFGTATPVPFRVVVNEELGYKLSVNLRCNGIYSYIITNPILFYTNVCGNVSSEYRREEIDAMLKGELMNALQPALSKIAARGVQYYELGGFSTEISAALNEELSALWRERRGIEVYSFNVGSVSIPEEQQKKITEWEENAMTLNPLTAAARLTGAQADAMRDAANNSGGAAVGFMGMNMAAGAGGMNAQSLYQMGAAQSAQAAAAQQAPVQSAPAAPAADTWHCSCGATASGKFCPECGSKKPEARKEGEWVCPKCGTKNTGKFCADCGEKKPEDADGWKCSCGAVNKGKFCAECGAKKPAAAKLYKCDKCGWEPEDPKNPPKFCPECGDRFDDTDVI